MNGKAVIKLPLRKRVNNMVNYHPTINPNDDLAVKYEDIYGCHNDFQI